MVPGAAAPLACHPSTSGAWLVRNSYGPIAPVVTVMESTSNFTSDSAVFHIEPVA